MKQVRVLSAKAEDRDMEQNVERPGVGRVGAGTSSGSENAFKGETERTDREQIFIFFFLFCVCLFLIVA